MVPFPNPYRVRVGYRAAEGLMPGCLSGCRVPSYSLVPKAAGPTPDGRRPESGTAWPRAAAGLIPEEKATCEDFSQV